MAQTFCLRGGLLPLMLGLCLAVPVQAQTQGGALNGFRLDLSRSEETVAGQTFSADADFLAKAGKEGWPPFDVIVPMAGAGSYQSRLVAAPETGLAKLSFVTPAGGFIESLSFSGATLPLADVEPRLEYFASLLRDQVVPGLTEGKADAEGGNTRPARLGDVEGVELFGSYTDPGYGKIHWRLVGLPHPEREEALVALALVADEAVPITSPDDFPATLGGRVLQSFSYR